MASFFTLELDTTAPIIEIYAPKYSNKINNNEITIVSDEKLSPDYQEIYIIDSEGTRHDVIFSFDGDKTYKGNVIFNDYPYGVVSIYAQVKDTVGNVSNLAVNHISVVTASETSLLRLSMLEIGRSLDMDFEDVEFNMSGKEKKITISDNSWKITMKEKTRYTKAKDIN